MLNGFNSPEEAAADGIPATDVRVVASQKHRDVAYVLLDTRPDGPPYLYGVNCYRQQGRWYEGSSGNGPGWSTTDQHNDRGTLVCWGEAPEGADRVRARFAGQVQEEAVFDNAYLIAWWDIEFPNAGWPRVLAFRIDAHNFAWHRLARTKNDR